MFTFSTQLGFVEAGTMGKRKKAWPCGDLLKAGTTWKTSSVSSNRLKVRAQELGERELDSYRGIQGKRLHRMHKLF